MNNEPASPFDERRVTRLFLLAVLLHGLVYLCAVAPWMGEDEPWHYEYASQIADGQRPQLIGANALGALVDEPQHWAASQIYARWRFHGASYEQLAARQREILASMSANDYFRRVDWAGAPTVRTDFDQVQPLFTATLQPPGYYALLGAWLAAWPGASVDSELLWGRVLSLVLYVFTAWCGLEFARRMFTDRSLALATAVAIAWYPMHARQAAVLNNDVLARVLTAAVLMLCARRCAGVGRKYEFGLALALALFAPFVKPTAASAIGVLIVAWLARSNLRRVLVPALGGAAAFAAAVWFLLRNSPVMPKSVAAFAKRIGAGLSLDTFEEMGTTFVGAFNWYSRELPSWAYALAALLGAVAFVSALVALRRRRAGVSQVLLVVCFAALAIQFVLVVFRGVGHGRYLMPALPAIAALFVVGLLAPLPAKHRPRAAALFIAAFVAFDALFLWGGLVPNEWLAWGS